MFGADETIIEFAKDAREAEQLVARCLSAMVGRRGFGDRVETTKVAVRPVSELLVADLEPLICLARRERHERALIAMVRGKAGEYREQFDRFADVQAVTGGYPSHWLKGVVNLEAETRCNGCNAFQVLERDGDGGRSSQIEFAAPAARDIRAAAP